jgi:hypothetical protein
MTYDILKGSGPYVAFGYNSIRNNAVRIGGFKTLTSAKDKAKFSFFTHKGVAKVTHPQEIWFYQGGKFIHLNEGLVWDIITLLGV